MDKVLEANKEKKKARGIFFFFLFIQTLNLPILLSWECQETTESKIHGGKEKGGFLFLENCVSR